jgi:ATP-dependent Clp endopeptidase proteolytic subunit ClpP
MDVPTLARPVNKRGVEGNQAKAWFRIENASASEADLYIMEEVGGWGVGASDFVRELSAVGAATIRLHLSSPGGDVFDGIAIYNALRNHPATVAVNIIGLAASAASFIAQAGDSVTIERNAQMMIHDAAGGCFGQASDMRTMADLLDKCSDNIADIYSQRAGGDVATWRAAMLAETWYSGAEAVAAGLADKVTGETEEEEGDDTGIAASYDLSRFRFQGRHNAPPPVIDMTPVAGKITPEEQPAAIDGTALLSALREVL